MPSSSRSRDRPELRVGCSGWNYESWKGPFYAPDLPASKWLAHYSSVFDTVEINNTFYRLPETSTFAGWREQMPDGFLAAVKASRFLTHMKRLRDPEEPLNRLCSRATALGSRLGPVLYQLPGNFHRDLDRLERFLHELPRRWPMAAAAASSRSRTVLALAHVIEFRHPSWYVDDTFALLERAGVALCLHDKAGSEIERPFIGPFVYVRFHGTSGRYHGSYADETLDRWAGVLAAQWRAGRDVYVYFNNDPDAVATSNALTLRTALASALVPMRSRRARA